MSPRRGWLETWLLMLVVLATGCRPQLSSYTPIVIGPVIEKLASGEGAVRLERLSYSQHNQRGQIWLGTIDPSLSDISVESGEGKERALEDIVPSSRRTRDHITINGGFYDDNGPLGLVVSHGHTIKRFRADGGSGVLVLEGGMPEIVHREAFRRTRVLDHALQSIDRLVADGQVLVARRQDAPRDARSLVGITAQQQLVVAVVFDQDSVSQDAGGQVWLNRQSTSTGPTLRELAELAVRPRDAGGLGCRWALNLDGGWSSAMRVKIGPDRRSITPYRGTYTALLASPRTP